MGAVDNITRSLSAALSTLLVAYPFYALIGNLSDLDPDNLRACNEGCTYIRFWGSPGLPRTAPRYLKDDRDLDDMPVFATVRNGESNLTMGTISGYAAASRTYTNLALRLSTFFVGGGDLFEALTGADVLNETNKAFVPAHCAGTSASAMRTKSDSKEQKRKVHNHLSLNSAVSLKLYMWSIPIWAILRTFHDWLIIWEMPEFSSLLVGHLSVLPQFVSVASGFLWCIGAAEVFRTTDNRHCACYFEMDTMAMFAVIATPVGL